MFIVTTLVSLIKTETYTPIMISDLFRHGARAPLHNWLNEEWIENVGPGNLTANGMRMHQILGSQIRKDYPTLFQKKYKKNHMLVGSH